MILKRNVAWGLLLCFAVFSMIVPLLMGLMAIPETVTGGGDIIIITQKDQSSPLNRTLVENLKSCPNVTALSPEIIIPTVVNGHPAMCRGVERLDMLELDGLTLHGDWVDVNTAVIGKDLARRMGVDVGSRITITSPSRNAVVSVEIVGTYSSQNPSDGLLISIEYARFLIGISPGSYTLIRLISSNPLDVQKIVDDSGIAVTNIEIMGPSDSGWTGNGGDGENITSGDSEVRITRRYTNFFSISESGGGFTSTAFIYGKQTVDAAVIALGIMTGVLVTVGVVVLILRGIAEGRKDVGVLMAIGATRNKLRMFFLKDLVFLVLLSAPLGMAVGVVLSYVIGGIFPLVAFGQTIAPHSTLEVLVFLASGAVLIPLTAWIIGGEPTIGEEPRSLFSPLELQTPFTTLENVLREEKK
ncbi:MAG: hypothetical protein QCI38_03210 [Candidatus Thermoplasmatota archaeon]|nr:hypothetical protein [Candidatus Thermoplasmatota archaeon]